MAMVDTYKAKLQLQIETDLKSLDELKKRLEKFKIGDPGVTSAKHSKANTLAEKIGNIKPITAADAQSMTAQELEDHLEKIVAKKKEYYKLVNDINTAAIKGMKNINPEQKQALQDSAKKQRQLSIQLRVYMDQLSSAKKKAEELNKAIREATNYTNVDTGDKSAIQKRIKDIGYMPQAQQQTKKIQEELFQLNKLLEDFTRLGYDSNKPLEQAKQEVERIFEEVHKTNRELDEQREIRLQTTKEIREAAVSSGEITEQQKEQLELDEKQLDVEQETTREKKKQQAIDDKEDTQKTIKDTEKLAEANKKGAKSFSGKVVAATLYLAALRALRQMIRSVINTVRELDKSITEVAMVTNMSRKEAWSLVDAYQNLAHEVGATTDEIARLSVYFFRQGRAAKDALELTRVAAIAAKVAAIDMSESANYLTSAINGFGLAAEEAMAVSDRFAALGASSASSYEEMAIALSKVAPVAKTAGVEIDFMLGVLAKGIETTREAPENIGTAFKTVFARMTQIREFGATLDDATGVNKVEEALKQANVDLRDSTGQFRSMGDVLTELGYKFSSLDRNQQAYIATALAGTRQQSRLLAVMQNFDRTMELVNISTNSAGATLAQHAEYAGGMQAANARLTNSFEKLVIALSDTQIIIDVINKMSEGLSLLAEEVDRNGPLMIGVLAGIGVAVLALTIKFGFLAASVTAATGGLNLIIPAVVAAGVALYALFRKPMSDAEKLEKRISELNEEIKQTQVNLYNNQKAAGTIRNLQTRYQQLSNQVVKSADDIAEMEELLEKIDEFSGNIEGKEYDLVINGKLNDDLTNLLDFYDAEIKESQNDLIDTGRELVMLGTRNTIDFDATETSAVATYLAQMLTGTTDVFSMSQEDQTAIFDLIYANFDEYIERMRVLASEGAFAAIEIQEALDMSDIQVGLFTDANTLAKDFGGSADIYSDALNDATNTLVGDVIANAAEAGLTYSYDDAINHIKNY